MRKVLLYLEMYLPMRVYTKFPPLGEFFDLHVTGQNPHKGYSKCSYALQWDCKCTYFYVVLHPGAGTTLGVGVLLGVLGELQLSLSSTIPSFYLPIPLLLLFIVTPL